VKQIRVMLKLSYINHGITNPQDADEGGGLQICRVAKNTWNKQSRTIDKKWTFLLGAGRRKRNT
jgi:hypothetical protein